MIEFLQTYGLVFVISMLPLSELRGAIPAGIAMDLNPWLVWLVSVAGNMIPVPFIILFIRSIFRWMRRRGGRMAGLVVRMEAKADRAAKLYYKYELTGLMILTAIPLPGTGAWTSALAAAMLNIRLKTATPFIFFGVCIAGLIMLVLSCGLSLLF